MQVARAAVGLVVLCHFPLNHHPGRQCFDDALTEVGWPVMSTTTSILFTMLFVYGAAWLAYVIRNLSAVLHFLGGTVGCFMILLLPGLMLMSASLVEHLHSQLALLEESGGGGHGRRPGEAADDGGDRRGEGEGEAGAASCAAMSVPLLHDAGGDRGGTKQAPGLLYSPRKSWWAGALLVLASGIIFCITMLVKDNCDPDALKP